LTEENEKSKKFWEPSVFAIVVH